MKFGQTPLVLAWVTKVSTSPNLYIEFINLIPKGLRDKFQMSPGKPQRERKPRSAIGLFKLLAS